MFTYNNRYIPYRNLACFVIETMAIFLSVVLSYLILMKWGQNGLISLNDIIGRGVFVALIAQFCMYILDLYDLNVTLSLYDILLSVTFTTGFVFIIIGISSIVVPDLGIGGQIYYLTGAFLFVFLLAWRTLLETYINGTMPTRNVLIFGGGPIAAEIAELIRGSRKLGFRLIGVIQNGSSVPATADGPRDAGGLLDIVAQSKVDHIVVAQQERRGIPIRDLLEAKVGGVQVIEWPAFYERLAGKIPVRSLPPSYFVYNDGFIVSVVSRILASATSFMLALAALSVCIPPLIIIAIMIKLDSNGPVFYRQERVGINGRRFKLIKFRTMVDDAEKETGAVWAGENDGRITRVGRYLRNYRIDEIPQLINILAGEMNLVGPRPERPEFVKILESEIPYYALRHSIKPGVTGWAQVKFCYSGTLEESREKLEYDLFYIKNRSFKLDCYIIFKTVKVLLLGRGAR